MSDITNTTSSGTIAGTAKVALSAAVLSLAALVAAAPAWAHVRVTADRTFRGGVAILTFEVPNESETGAPTTQLSVALPNVTSAHTEVMSGWTAQLDHDIAAGIFRSVTWSAAPNAGIPADQFALFRIEVTLPDSDTASFPATQTYADGKVVRWDQPPLPGGGEPEHPAPMLTLTTAADRRRRAHQRTGRRTRHAGLRTAAHSRQHRALAGRRRNHWSAPSRWRWR